MCKFPAKAQRRKATSRAHLFQSPALRLCALAGNSLSRTELGRLASLVALILACSFITISQAQLRQPPTNDPPDPAVEQRLANLSQELRCLVCQNETLADSRADLAEDLRREIREQIRAGKSDQEIISFLTQRYGEFILYRPPVKPKTYLLWFGPFVLLLVGLAILFRYVKRRRNLIPEQPLSNADHRRAQELLGSGSGKETV
jgi:cytochrome c-type biogenesis protein CcmH